jgi:UDP-glucose 4-epimerase
MTAPLTGFSAFNVGTGMGTDVNALAAQVRGACVAALADETTTTNVPHFGRGPSRAGDLRCNLISPAKAGLQLNWRPAVSLAKGIDETVDWLVQHQMASTGPG